MKKIQKKSATPKKIVLATSVVIALLIAFVTFAYATKNWPFNNSTNQTSGIRPDEVFQENATKDDSPSYEDIPTKTTDQIPANNSVSITVDELTQSNGVVRFKATTTSTASGGKCSLTLTNPNDKPVTRTVDAKVSNSVDTCGPIEIPEQEFSYLGEWTATLRYYINDTQVVVTKAINIQ